MKRYKASVFWCRRGYGQWTESATTFWAISLRHARWRFDRWVKGIAGVYAWVDSPRLSLVYAPRGKRRRIYRKVK